MTQAIFATIVLTIVFLAAALLVVWSRRSTWLRAGAIPLAIVSAAGAGIVLGSTLGFAVPLIPGITAPPGDAFVLSAKSIVNDGIYVTFDLPSGPRLYWLPWDRKRAEQLQEMLDDPGNAGVKATLPPFEWSWDMHPPSFQPLPQPKWLPDKPPEDPNTPPPPRFAA